MSTVCKPDRGRTALLIAVVAIASAGGRAAGANVSPPPPKTYVEDLAGVIDAGTEQKLLGYLQELEQKTGAQFIVLTIPTTGGEPIEAFSLRLAEAWKLGQKGKDNGLLLVVAVRDRKYRFETGYGLEGPLPDSLLGSIGRSYFVPNFRRNQYSKGIHDGVVAVLDRLSAFYKVKLAGVPQLQGIPVRGRTARGAGVPACGVIPLITIFVALIVISRLFRYWLGFWGLTTLFGHGGGSHRSGGSWGGGGGGFGSFGGGGGGGFGGGGASGGW